MATSTVRTEEQKRKHAKYMRWYNQSTPERCEKAINRARKYAQEHREEARRRANKWYYENKERAKESVSNWRKKNEKKVKEYLKRYSKKWKKENRVLNNTYTTKRLERKGQTRTEYTQKEWSDKLKETCGICPRCNEDVGIDNLTLDHIIPISKAPKGFIYTIKDIQPLCGSVS